MVEVIVVCDVHTNLRGKKLGVERQVLRARIAVQPRPISKGKGFGWLRLSRLCRFLGRQCPRDRGRVEGGFVVWPRRVRRYSRCRCHGSLCRRGRRTSLLLELRFKLFDALLHGIELLQNFLWCL